ncbi:hypothetical protein M8J76_010006 [Diaphorina citri]|nr:hypothetical protein M8J76_010006 [Diaphorina citri]
MNHFIIALTLLCVGLDLCACVIMPDCEACAAENGECAVLNGPGHPKCRSKSTGCYFKIWICDKFDNCNWSPYSYQKVNCATCHGTCNAKAQTCEANGKTLHFVCKDINSNCNWVENARPDPCTGL